MGISCVHGLFGHELDTGNQGTVDLNFPRRYLLTGKQNIRVEKQKCKSIKDKLQQLWNSFCLVGYGTWIAKFKLSGLVAFNIRSPMTQFVEAWKTFYGRWMGILTIWNSNTMIL